MMIGTFNEMSLHAYAKQAEQAYKERRAAGTQGTESHDNYGVGDNDHSFIDNDESTDADDHAKRHDFTTCLRSNGTRYGIAPS
jgi:hypothetical protein